MVFADGKTRSIESIVDVFEFFERISGLRISMEKSTIYFAGIKDDMRHQLEGRFQFESKHLPVRYLGLPLLTKQMRTQDYQPLIEKIKQRISAWTNRFLSMAGRLQLIKSVLASITNFWMSAFCLPGKCLKEIDRLCSAFLWSGPALTNRNAKVAWDVVCRAKREGGLGLRPLKESNTVCCLKLIWRIVSFQPSLWVKWIHIYLIRQENLWSLPDITRIGSWVWRKLLKYRELAKTFHKMEVKNGNRTSFWYDSWSGLGRLSDITGPRGSIDLGIRSNASIASALCRRSRRHRTDVLNAIETVLTAQRAKIMVDMEDLPLWKQKEATYRSIFNAKRTWNLIRKTSPQIHWYRGIWFAHATPKYAFFSWLAIQDRLSTGDRMAAWGTGANPTCIFCQHSMESRDHLFFTCWFSTDVWTILTRGLLQSRFTTVWSEVIGIILDTRQDRLTTFLSRYVFQIAIHSIWRERNERRHGASPNTPATMAKMIDKQIRNRCISIRAEGDFSYEASLQLWFATRN